MQLAIDVENKKNYDYLITSERYQNNIVFVPTELCHSPDVIKLETPILDTAFEVE